MKKRTKGTKMNTKGWLVYKTTTERLNFGLCVVNFWALCVLLSHQFLDVETTNGNHGCATSGVDSMSKPLLYLLVFSGYWKPLQRAQGSSFASFGSCGSEVGSIPGIRSRHADPSSLLLHACGPLARLHMVRHWPTHPPYHQSKAEFTII